MPKSIPCRWSIPAQNNGARDRRRGNGCLCNDSRRRVVGSGCGSCVEVKPLKAMQAKGRKFSAHGKPAQKPDNVKEVAKQFISDVRYGTLRGKGEVNGTWTRSKTLCADRPNLGVFR